MLRDLIHGKKHFVIKTMAKKSLFGKFSPFKDESVHVILALLVSLIGVISGLDMSSALIILFAGLLIDLDHIFNPYLAMLIGVKNYNGGIAYHADGYSFKILHGYDISFIIGLIVWLSGASLLFSIFLFLVLSIHQLWDTMVYPYSWKEAFLITRILSGFCPGERKKYRGIFFDIKTLKY